MPHMPSDPIERLPELANNDSWLIHRGRFLNVTFLLEVGRAAYLIRIERGRVADVAKGPFAMPRWTFALRAPEEAWSTFWTAAPPPGFHDLIAMSKARALKIEGDQHPFMSNLRYFKDLLALPRSAQGVAP
jgi:hypothetical protein